MKRDLEKSVAKEFSIDSTRVKICTDYCANKTGSEINNILSNIEKGAIHNLNEASFD